MVRQYCRRKDLLSVPYKRYKKGRVKNTKCVFYPTTTLVSVAQSRRFAAKKNEKTRHRGKCGQDRIPNVGIPAFGMLLKTSVFNNIPFSGATCGYCFFSPAGWKQVPTCFPAKISYSTSGFAPFTRYIGMPASLQISAACSLVMTPPVPRSVPAPPAQA